MAESDPSLLPSLSPEQRRAAAGQFDRANQVIAAGNHDYGIQLLLSCCKLDPGNLVYRQTLRRTEKAKYKNNLRGSRFAALSTSAAKARLKLAKRSRNHLKVLEHGEEVLTGNPWDTGTQMDMGEAADALGLLDMAIWILDQARQKDAELPALNRSLARLFEKRGNFTQAIFLWTLVKKVDPSDVEANHKAKDLSASETIARGNYEEAMGGDAMAGKVAPEGDSGPRSSDRITREVKALETRIQTNPTHPSGYIQLSNLFRREKLQQQAREALQKGLDATGNHYQLSFELAEMELEPFRSDLALTEEKLKADSQNEELRKIRHGLQKEINTRELDLFRLKADRFPNELAHRLEVGIRLMRLGQIDEAIKELQAARADNRIQWRSLWFLGHCFKSRNNWRLAKRNFEEALQNLPPGEDATRKEILFQLAQGSADAGDLSAAVELGHELANLDFGYKDIGRRLDEWEARVQQA